MHLHSKSHAFPDCTKRWARKRRPAVSYRSDFTDACRSRERSGSSPHGPRGGTAAVIQNDLSGRRNDNGPNDVPHPRQRRLRAFARHLDEGNSIGAADLTQVGAVRDRAADRIDRRVADDEVEVGAFRAERVVAGLADLRARLPPTVLPADDVRLQTLVQLGSRADAAFRRLDSDPVAGANAARGGRDGAELELRVSGTSTQARERAMLTLAELRGLRAGQDQGIALGQVRARDGADQRLDVIWQRRVAVLQERL